MPMVAMPDSRMEAKGRSNVSVPYLVSKLSAGLESGSLLIENVSKFNLSLCVCKSQLLTQSCQLQTAPGKPATFSDLDRHIMSFQLPEWVQPCH